MRPETRKCPSEARRWRTSARNRHKSALPWGWMPGAVRRRIAARLARQGLGRGLLGAVVAGGHRPVGRVPASRRAQACDCPFKPSGRSRGGWGASVAQGALAASAGLGLASGGPREPGLLRAVVAGGHRPVGRVPASPRAKACDCPFKPSGQWPGGRGAHPPPRLGWAWPQAGRVNRGGRFSMKARTASRWSSVAAQRTKRSASIARQVFKSAPSARWMFSFM